MRHNGGMYMSVEVISIILAAAGILITLGGGFLAGLAWMLRRMDEQFDKVDKRFDRIDQRFEQVDQRFEKVDERFERMHEQIGQVQSELNDVKVAVARLEGPQPRLILPR